MVNFIGMTFGSYKLVAPLGRGGMGTVYRGYQESIDRSVAIKLLPAELLSDPSFLTRFTEEARALSKLTHPAILPLYEYGQANGLPYIVMPIMANGNFAERMKANGGPLTLSETVKALTPIAAALDFAHQQNVIHRDIKPSNILFDSQDHAVLADFGLAKMLESELETGSGSVSGTPAYMSPEQALGHKLDGRSDLYSLGVVAYEALVGQTPFYSKNVIQLAMKHVNEAPPKPRDVRPEISKAVEDSILKVLAKERGARFATAGEFLQALSNAAYLSRDFWRPTRHGHSDDVPSQPELAAPPGPSPVTPVVDEKVPVAEKSPVEKPPAAPKPSAPVGAASPRNGDTLMPMDSPTLSGDPYTQIAAPAGIDPYDIPDATLVGGSTPNLKAEKPQPKPSPSDEPYTQIAAPEGIDPYDIPDATLVGGSTPNLKIEKPEPDEDDSQQPPTLV